MWAGTLLALVTVVLIPIQADDIRLRIENENVFSDSVDAAVNFGIAFAVVINLTFTGLWIWMAIMNHKGRNWARITGTVFGGLYLGFGLIGIAFGALFGSEQTINTVITAVTMIIAVVTIVLLWQRTSSSWYAAKP